MAPLVRLSFLALALVPIAAVPQVKQPKTRDLSKGNTLYVVPYAHLDTQWRWAYPQVIREYIANTLHDNFALIDKYPNYVFNFSGSRRYEMMKEYYPADYERLKGYIKAGRWFPCGSSVDENDANVPSAESLIRQVLYGNHYFRREFGTASEEYMLPDCFGFPYALPSVLAHCGIKGFSTQKLTWGSAVGIPFKIGRWIGPDGKSVVAALDPGSYGADITEDLSVNSSWLARIKNTGDKSGAYVDYHYYGTGDTGGAPRSRAVEWVEKSMAGTGPISVVSSQSDELFRSITPQQTAKLPSYQGELLLTEHSAGSITSQAYMKRWNRKNELLADAAERASVAAAWLGTTPYPSKRLYDAWDLVLGSQMHDMLPGTSIPKAYEFCWNDELLALNQFGAVTTDAVGAVAQSMDTTAKGQALVVYNPLSVEREDVVEATITGVNAPDFQAFDPEGHAVQTQTLWSKPGEAKILFLAKVAPNSFSTYEVRGGAIRDQLSELMKVDTRGLESSRFKVSIDANGDIASIFDKREGKEVLKAPSRLAFQYHNPSAFPAWNMDWDDAQKPPTGYVDGPPSVRIVENGPVRVALEVTREAMGSKFVQTIRLASGEAGDRVEVLNTIDWQTKERALKASFPLTTGNPLGTYDLQLGAIQRGNNDPKKYEVPQHQWLDLSKADNSYGVAILNDCKFGSDKPDDDTVRLTLLYTPGVRSGFADQATQDFGRHQVLYAIAPHKGGWAAGQVAWKAKRLNQPLKVFAVTSHAGKLGRSFSLLKTSTDQVEVSAMKKAEDSDEVVVRLRELTGKSASDVRLQVPVGIVSAREVDGQERTIGTAKVANGTLTTSVPAFSLRTFALKLKGAPAAGVKAKTQPVKLRYESDVASRDANRGDGDFDGMGRSIPAELLPGTLTVDGIDFKLGPTADGVMNAVPARGQKIELPAGYNKAYVLAAAYGKDVDATFRVGRASAPARIQNWNGYVGQWDNRSWKGDLGPNYQFYGDWAGLAPGYVKKGEVAWFSSHCHNPKGNEYYVYNYLQKFELDLPAGATTLELPSAPVQILAVTVARDTHDGAVPAAPLSDDLAGHDTNGKATIDAPVGAMNDAVTVSIHPPLYWQAGQLRYTLDGSAPNASSPVYEGPINLNDPTKLRAALVTSNGLVGEAVADIAVRDTTPPHIVQAYSSNKLGIAQVTFSERVRQDSAENPASYELSSGAKVSRAKLREDGRTVDLVLEAAVASTGTQTLRAKGVKDWAKDANSAVTSMEVTDHGPLVAISPEDKRASKPYRFDGLPYKARDHWTVSVTCKVDQEPPERTIIAGFGRATDGRTGRGRYFTSFPEGINFWVANRDVMSSTKLDIGKWQTLTATYDGAILRLYKNGELIAEQEVELADDGGQVWILPVDAWEQKRMFGGEVSSFTLWDIDFPPAVVKRLAAQSEQK
ncbi:MAG: chitobiase/beta-hexosaminidase C-terminal domain-containing protein [Armatimonadetes bacterium]|nr:chitobiase/beta-hexosaminidase C-terminal domain-containing protein [Armatimonadota bacterium]